MAYSISDKNALRDQIEAELITKFGAPDVPSQLEDYADAMAIAIATILEGVGSFPSEP